MRKIQSDVADFHVKFGRPISRFPKVISDLDSSLRKNLITEEFTEVIKAIDDKDLVEIADGIADLIYVLMGTALEYGIDMEPIWEEVHSTNMEKVGGKIREDGKILKPDGWKAPNIKELLSTQDPLHLGQKGKRIYMQDKILKNMIKCKFCQEIIESKHVHDFVTCKCGQVSVDGGTDYLKRCFKRDPELDFEELSIIESA